MNITSDKILLFLNNNEIIASVVFSLLFLAMYYIGTPDKYTAEREKSFGKVFLFIFLMMIIGIGLVTAYSKITVLKDYAVHITSAVSFLSISIVFYSKFRNIKKSKIKPNVIIAQQDSIHPLTKKVDKLKIRKSLQDFKKIKVFRKIYVGTGDDTSKTKNISIPALSIREIDREILEGKNYKFAAEKGFRNTIEGKIIKPTTIKEIKRLSVEIENEFISSLSETHEGVISLIESVYAKIQNTEEILSFRKTIKQIRKTLETKKMKRFAVEKYLFNIYKNISLSKENITSFGRRERTITFIYPITNLYLLANNEEDERFLSALQQICSVKVQPYGCEYFYLLDIDNYIEEQKQKEEILKKEAKELEFTQTINLSKEEEEIGSKLEEEDFMLSKMSEFESLFVKEWKEK